MALGANALRAGKAVIEVGLLVNPVLKQLRMLQQKVKSVGQSFSQMGQGGGGFANLRNLFVSSAAATAAAWPVKLAANMELATAEMSVFTGDTASAKKAMDELMKFSAVSGQGPEEMANQMRLLMTRGLGAEESLAYIKSLTVLAAGSTDEFEQLTKAFADVRSSTKLNGEEMRQFKNTAFNPFVEIAKKTGETMKQLKDRMEAGGISFDEVAEALQRTVSAGGAFHGMLDKIAGTLIGQIRGALADLKMMVLPLGEELLKPITKFFKAVRGVMPILGKWIKENKGLAITALKITVAVAGAAAAFAALALAGTVVTLAIGGIASMLALILNPITLIAVALASATGALLYFSKTARQALSSVMSILGQVGAFFTKIFSGMGDALMAGDFKLAFQIAVAGLQVVWQNLLYKLKQAWEYFKFAWDAGIIEITAIAKTAWKNMVNTMIVDFIHFRTKTLNILADIKEAFGQDVTAEREIINTGATAELNAHASGLVGQLDAIETERANKRWLAFKELLFGLRDIVDGSGDAQAELQKLLDIAKELAAASGKPKDWGLGKIFPKIGEAAAVAGKTAGSPEAFFDPRLARQMTGGGDAVQREQLAVQKKIERNTARAGLAFG